MKWWILAKWSIMDFLGTLSLVMGVSNYPLRLTLAIGLGIFCGLMSEYEQDKYKKALKASLQGGSEKREAP